eukprot:CAMPEP_0168458264 /NCGR_PEP_ID=MMETSP0228-20121227/52288_1 /TAXON_ID=133427 /ORGANISM="Protoceratium reticulatum, Strain CCCM 535 (=CCMP 1889)" /LENGTH=51 /DNA_ID=CAMNT_0008473359 /DNA_START=183 /DNA_END=334 /DNA_ORIENTATION=-
MIHEGAPRSSHIQCLHAAVQCHFQDGEILSHLWQHCQRSVAAATSPGTQPG